METNKLNQLAERRGIKLNNPVQAKGRVSEALYKTGKRITAIDKPEPMKTALSELGEPPSLTSFPAEADSGYSVADFLYFENTIIYALAVIGKDYAAKKRTDELIKAGVKDEQLRVAARGLHRHTDKWKEGGLAGRASFSRSFQREVDAKAITPPYEWSQPIFNHEAVSKLYEIPGGEEGYEHILNLKLDDLPRNTLIADLRTVLRDMIVRFEKWRKDEEGAPFETMEHAVKLLAYYEATEALPDMLDLIRMDGEFIEHFFGWDIEETLRVPLYRLGKDQIGELYDYLLERGNDSWSRSTVASTFTQVGLHNSKRRGEAIDWFEKLFSYLLDHRDDRGLMDTNFITSAITYATDLRAPELFSSIRRLYELRWVSPGMMGDLYEIEYHLHLPPDPKDLLALPTDLRGYYAREAVRVPTKIPTPQSFQQLMLKNTSPVDRLLRRQRDSGVVEAAVPPIPDLGASPVTKSQKVGRNEPCPCGSGRKYKRCCWGN